MAKLDCDDVVNARGNLAPLECESLIGPLTRDFLLTDVALELYDHPNGNQSRACGYLWNVMEGQWSRRVLGGYVQDPGRQYHFETGILCPRGSRLSVCTCFFVYEPTSRLWVVLSGYYCEESRWEVTDLVVEPLPAIDWMDVQPREVIDPGEPTPPGEATQDVETSMVTRKLLGTTRDSIDHGDLWIEGVEERAFVAAGETAAVQVSDADVAWRCADRDGTSRCPDGTNFVVVRRSVDGRSVHWICYREQHEAGGQEA